jgi:hypothetical protein
MTKSPVSSFVPRTAADSLALEIAQAFNDERHLSTYRKVCQRRNYSFVYKAYRETMAIPPHRIKKSRRAIFFFLLRAYDKKYRTRY